MIAERRPNPLASPTPVPSSSLQEICALFGQPVAGNPTQFMIEKAFAQHGLEWRYLTLEVAPVDTHTMIQNIIAHIGLQFLFVEGDNFLHAVRVLLAQRVY